MRERIAKIHKSTSSDGSSSKSELHCKKDEDDELSVHYEIGDRVEGRLQGYEEWVKCKIISMRQDGSYDVRYDNGDEELKVRPEMIRPLGRPRRASLDRQIRRSTDNVKQEGKLDTTMFRQRDDQGTFAELREHKAKTQRSSSSDLRNMRHEASGADNRVDSRISDRTKPVKDDFDGAWQTKTFSGHYVGEHKEEKVNARCKPSSRSGRLHSYSDESSSKGRPSPRELSPEKIGLSATGSHEDKYANSDIESHSARYASESKTGDGTEASKVARFKTAHRAQFATNAMAWGKDGLLPRALVAKLATVASSMHIFGRIITELYRRDEEETGAISKEDWITILEESSIYLSDEDILCLWQVMGHQQVQKLYYWDLLQLALGECETDELADLHVKLLRRFKLTAPAPKTLHEDLLAFFQKYDRRARGHVPYSLLEKALRRLGVKLEKFERSSILDRFAGCKPYSVQYEACILWMTSGLDTKRTVRKLEHMTELLAAKQQIDLMQLICACDPKGTGTIPAVDFQRILRQHGVALTAGELRALALWYRRGKVGLSYKQITGNLSAICPPPENTASVQKPVLAASVPGVALKRSLRNEDDLKRSQSTPPMQGATSMRAEKWSTQQGPLAPVPTASDFDCSSVVDQLTAKLQQAAEYIKDEVDLWTRLRRRDEENQGAVPMESVREELMGMGVVLESSETECIHVCYGLTQDGRIHYDDIVWLAHERLPESHPLRLDILVAVVRQFFSRNQAPTETFDTLKDYLMAADADEQGHISSADFIRILKRVNNLGLDTRQMSAVCEGFRLRGSLEASMTLGRAELSKDEFTPQSVMSTSTRSMHPPSSFALRFPEGSQHHSSDRSAERQISTTALVAQLPPHVNYAEFLLWIDRNCVEDQSERQLLMLKRSVRRHMQKGVDVAEITQNGSGQQGISAEMFGRILASFGFMMSRLSLMSLYHKLARGADHILPEVLLQSLLPEYRTIMFGARSVGIIPPQSRNPVGHKRALVSSAPYPGNQRSEASARLDAELQSVLGRAMERAFRHFDVDNSNTIDVEDFVEVLRALGQDLSSKEVRSIIKSGRGTDTLHFEEFEKIVYPYLRERLSQECRVSEDALRQLFQAMDNQGSGAIAPQDLKYALVSRLRVMTDLEATAVVDALPIPKGGLICWAEFHRFLRLAQDGCESTSTTDLFRANSEALTALKKLKFGTIPDPDTYLSSLLGMPSNVRESVLASLELKGEHLVEVALRPVVTIDDSGLSIKDLPVRLVPLDNGEPGFLPLKRQRPYHAILQPIGTLQQQADGATSIGQIGLILNGASGIPVPDDRRMPDIVSRNVRACLLLENPTKRRKSQFISNIHNILARQDPNREECWLFPDNDLTSPSMIIRINLAKLHDSDIELAKENLHVLLELSVTVSADPAALTRGKVYYHNDLDEEANNKVKEGISGKASKGTSGMSLRSKLIRRPRPKWQKAWEGRTEHLEQHSTDREAESIDEMLYEGGHTTDSAVETETSRPSSLLDRRRSHQIDKGKGSSPSRRQKIRLKNASHRSSRPTKGSRPAVLRKVPLRKRHQKSTPSKAEVTLSCGWCKLPLLKLAALESEQAQSVDLIGGTPFVDDAIKISEIRARRTGWRALLQRLINVDVRSQLEIRAVPVGKMSMKSQQHIYMLPTTIIIAKADISLVRTYRELLAVRIHSGRLDVNAQPMRGRSSSSSDPVLALFPRIIGDRAMRSVLHMHWARAVRALSFAERQNPMAYCHILSETIMRMWPAYCIHTARPNVLSGRSTESAEGVRDRMRLIGRMIKDPGSGTQIRHPNGSTGTTSPSIPSLLSTTLRGLPGAASASFTTGASPLHLTAENDETVHSAFHTKEVVFEVSSESSTRIGS